MPTMLIVERELVLDLTEEDKDYEVVLKEAIDSVLNKEIHEFTLVSHLNRDFKISDLTQILQQSCDLEVLSLFSVALSGTIKEFDQLGKVLRQHKGLKEVHMVDCGMLGNWTAPGENESVSTRNSNSSSKHSKQSRASGNSKFSKSSRTAMSTRPSDSTTKIFKNPQSVTHNGSMSVSMASSATIHAIAPTLDVLLNSLACISTLENVELYGVPAEKFDRSSDGDQESGHQVVQEEGEADNDIPMVPMGNDESANFSDNDYLADYNEDIRGIPGHGKAVCKKTKKLSLLMSPKSMGALCRSPNLSNLGMEDIRLQDEHITLLAEAFSAKGHKIKELKLYGCNIGDVGAIAISKMLRVNTTLEKLDLSYNNIDDAGCIAIATALLGNQKLHTLNLVGNRCADNYDAAESGGCYDALLELLEKNKTLKDLILEPSDQDDSSDVVPEFIFIPTGDEISDDVSSASDE